MTETALEANKGFGNLGLNPKLVQTLTEFGYEEPTPIQRETIPPLLAGKDVIGQAATGTGKTAAFALPMLQRIAERGTERPKPSALVLVPTRELAMQVAEAMHKYGHKLKIAVVPIYGGHSFAQQQRMLERGVDVVVATPGRAVDHIGRKTMDLSGISILVLDEADEMLDLGFAEDLETILSETPAGRQTVFFSATLPPRIAGMVKRHMTEPLSIQIASEPVAKGAAPKVRQTAYIVPRGKKLEVLGRVLDLENPASTLVFCRTRTEVDNLTERLGAQGYRAQALHGGITQDQRTRVIKRLREGAIDLVIATDVAARGLDIEQLALVVNYDVPATPDSYVHRIGRVGRAGREGVAITLADPRESRLLQQFERQTKNKIERAQVPTVADLRARRLELTRAALREAILAGGLDHYRVAVESLAQEHDLMDIALAAVKLAHQATGGDTEEDNEPAKPAVRSTGSTGSTSSPQASSPRAHSGLTPSTVSGPAPSMGSTGSTRSPQASSAKAREEPRRTPDARMARIYVGAGRNLGFQPQNLVGAVTAEGVKGSLIGTVEICDKYSLVEVPESVFDAALQSMRNSLIKGKKVVVRRFVEK
jgi:ATP-dependent RNA helicase DeaD